MGKKWPDVKKPKDYGFSVEEATFKYPFEKLLGNSGKPEFLKIKKSFDIKAEEFMDFAEKDLKGYKEKDIVNALGNIKRAIENRVDHLLYLFGYSKFVKKYNFPEKLKKLNKVNIIAPRILNKINRIRNLLEHKYVLPNKDKVVDAFDVALLFLESTKFFIKRFVKEGECIHKNGTFSYKFLSDGVDLDIYAGQYNQTKIFLNATLPEYDDWIKFIIKLVY